MNPYDIVWFQATLFGPKFPTLTAAEYDFVFAIAESELVDVACWCPKLYPTALQLKIAFLLEGLGIGAVAGAAPVATPPGGTHEAYVVEDEVYDVRRKYKIVEKQEQLVMASSSGQLQGIIDRCKKPLSVGAFIAGGIYGAFGGCCTENSIGDKAEWNHGGQ
jgi:hypothetical protein